MLGTRLERMQHVLLQWLLRQERQHDHVSMRLRLLAWLGCLGMPLYYVVWTRWFPQEYENLPLRLLGVLLCLPALCTPARLRAGAWWRSYEFVGVSYVLPFFFSFMLLKNHGSAVWSQSLLVGLMVLFQFDWLWALASLACGVVAACAAFAFCDDPAFLIQPRLLEQLPIYLFTIVFVSVAKVGRRVLEREKLAGMAQALGVVSHELRTPLASVAANVRGIERALDGAAADVPAADAEAVADALARIRHDVRHMNQMVDLFLASATAMNRQLSACEPVAMSDVVRAVVERYPFADEAERARVEVVIRSDFSFRGRRELSVVVLLNLLRNALKALRRAGRGRVRIVVDGAGARVRVLDSGCGIPARQLPLIFERFHSYPPHAGAGIGLALCKDIVQAWEGRIRCRSRERAYTVFTLEFPPAAAATAARLA